MSGENLMLCVNNLMKNTDRESKTLYNGKSTEVLIAIARLSQKGNEAYLKLYSDWLESFKAEKKLDKAAKKIEKAIDKTNELM